MTLTHKPFNPDPKRMKEISKEWNELDKAMDTPDTEDWEKSKNEFMQKWMYSERLCCNGDYCTAHCAEDKWKEIEKLLTSQTTYWKERAEEAVKAEREKFAELIWKANDKFDSGDSWEHGIRQWLLLEVKNYEV